MTRTAGSLSGLSDDEARDFHRVFMSSFVVFTLIAVAAHFLVWNWRPWIPGVAGYQVTKAPVEQVQHVATTR